MLLAHSSLRGWRDASAWEARFIDLAAHVAGWSKDPSTKVGAVAVGDSPNILSIGYNGFPPGIEDSPDRLNDRAWKNEHVIHAELNALFNARFDPVHLYCTHVPCHRCAVHILGRRTIKRVITPAPEGDYAERWAESIARSNAVFDEAGVERILLHQR